MIFKTIQASATGLLFLTLPLHAATLYVDVHGTNATPPYANWSTAATNIQDAIDASSAGDLILVTNGLYATGGRTVNGYELTNRIAIDKAVAVQSVNGPEQTIIEGYQLPAVTNGDAAVRCVYMTNGASLTGFTLTNGATRNNNGDWYHEQNGGGVWCDSTNPIISNCIIVGNAAGGSGAGAIGGTFNNCAFENNFAFGVGGGAYNSTLRNCSFVGNYGSSGGGGVYWDYSTYTAYDCTFTNNWSDYGGGGASGGYLQRCIFVDNFCTTVGSSGGGAQYSTLVDCILAGNSAGYGGGADESDVYDCMLTNNNAAYYGGGVSYCYGANCTIINNSAAQNGGGSSDSELNNCIVYFNAASTNANMYFKYTTGPVNYSCTIPLPPTGLGNFTNTPLFVDQADGDLRLQTNSPCINAGNNNYLSNNADAVVYGEGPIVLTNDLDGNPRVTGLVVDVGAYEYFIPAAISADYTNVIPGFTANFYWQVFAGNVSQLLLDFADGTIVTNPVSAGHSWAAPGVYPVSITAFSDLYPGGISATCVVHVAYGNYVSINSTSPTPPYTSWETAATNIQDAVNSGFADGIVWVSNGVYQTGMAYGGGSTLNRIAVSKPLVLRSINGPEQTVIDGGGVVRCAYLDGDVAIDGFTLRNGSIFANGGGALCDSSNVVVTNCIFAHNMALFGGGVYGGRVFNSMFTSNSIQSSGGGACSAVLSKCVLIGNNAVGEGGAASDCTLTSCIIMSNSCSAGGGVGDCTVDNSLIVGNLGTNGGGAYQSVLNNCTLVGNAAVGGGGADSSTLANCIIYYNATTAISGQETVRNIFGGTLNYCCTTPLFVSGTGNITNEPAFVDLAGADFHLQANSPCINSGNNSSAAGTTDFDGNPRIKGGTVDMGAYEYQSPVSTISYAWLQQYGLPITTNIDSADIDGTGFNVYQDWIAGLNPTNALSVLAMLPPVPTNNPVGLVVSWESVSNRNYFLQSSTNLGAQPAFSTIQSNINGQPDMTSYTDTNAVGNGPYFYRVGVQ